MTKLFSSEAIVTTPAQELAASKKLQCVVYRTGGTRNFKWQRTVAGSPEHITKLLADIKQQGFEAFAVNYKASMAIGLPETFDVKTPLEL